MGLFPKATYPYDLGLPVGPNSNCYFVDPTNGNDSYKGTCPEKPMQTVAAAEAKCVANQNDAVVLIGIAAANALAEMLLWDKDYTHLVGLSANLPGVGQRCRITGSDTADLLELITISGNGCIFRNLQLYNGADKAQNSGAATLTGDRCEFTNVFFSGINNAAIVGIRAGAFSLTMNGAHENMFLDCTIGADTIVRAAANAELVMTGTSSKNTFRRCYFMSAGVHAAKLMVKITPTVGGCGINWFNDCCFFNNAQDYAEFPDNCFSIAGTAGTYYVDVTGSYLIGIDGWADVVTHIYSAQPAPNAGFGISTAPTT